MKTTTKKGRLVLCAALAAVVLAVLALLLVPISLDRILVPGGRSITHVSITEVRFSEKPRMYTVMDGEKFMNCFRHNYAQWRGLNGSTVVQTEETMYILIIDTADGDRVTGTVADGKLYCGNFCYALSDAAETEMAARINAAIADTAT